MSGAPGSTLQPPASVAAARAPARAMNIVVRMVAIAVTSSEVIMDLKHPQRALRAVAVELDPTQQHELEMCQWEEVQLEVERVARGLAHAQVRLVALPGHGGVEAAGRDEGRAQIGDRLVLAGVGPLDGLADEVELAH